MTLQIKWQVFANNELRVTFADMVNHRKYAGDCMDAKKRERIADIAAYLQTEVVGGLGQKYLVDRYMKTARKLTQDEVSQDEEARIRSLDILCEFQRARVRYKSDKIDSVNRDTRFTLYARRTILEAAACLDSTLAHPSDAAVVTLTLPGSGDAAFRTIASHSGYICNRLLQVVRRHSPEALWFYCWELQKRGALHIHLCISAGSREASLDTAGRVRQTWISMLQELETRLPVGLCTSERGAYCYLPHEWQNDIQSLHSSVGGYFGKYCSKNANGADPKRKGFGGKRIYSPKRWWGCCRKLLGLVKSRRRNVVLKGFTRDTFDKIRLIWAEFLEVLRPVISHSFDFEIGRGLGRVREESLYNQSRAVRIGVGHTIVSYVKPEQVTSLHEELTSLIATIAGMEDGLSVAMQGCSNDLLKEVLNAVPTANRLLRSNSAFCDSLVIM